MTAHEDNISHGETVAAVEFEDKVGKVFTEFHVDLRELSRRGLVVTDDPKTGFVML